jgi:hypothetical protein
MDLTDRFFGKGTPELGGPPIANPSLTEPPAFALLFGSPLDFQADALTLALRDYHPELASATAELMPAPQPPGEAASQAIMGLVGWGRHVVKVVGFGKPMPAKTVEQCVRPAHYDSSIKNEAYQHTSHVLLFYAGYEPDPLEQYVALSAVGAALTRFGAVAVLNERACTSVPAVVLLPHEEDQGDTLAALRALPIPFLYAGFVKLEIEGEPKLWMRTYGCHTFRLPDLAFQAEGHHQGTATFNLFANMLAYLRESGKSFTPGDTMNVGEGMFLRLRARTPEEWYLDSPGEMFVAEKIASDEANK